MGPDGVDGFGSIVRIAGGESQNVAHMTLEETWAMKTATFHDLTWADDEETVMVKGETAHSCIVLVKDDEFCVSC